MILRVCNICNKDIKYLPFHNIRYYKVENGKEMADGEIDLCESCYDKMLVGLNKMLSEPIEEKENGHTD